MVPYVRGMQPRRGCRCVNKNRIQSMLTNREKLNRCLWALSIWDSVPGLSLALSYLPDVCDYLIHGCKVCVAINVLKGNMLVEVLKCVLDFQEDQEADDCPILGTERGHF